MLPEQQIQQIRARAEQGHGPSQFLLSQLYQQDGDLENMMGWLQKAVSNNVPDALDALGFCYEKGTGVTQDYPAALTHYEQAAAAGCHHAVFRRAEVLYKSRRAAEVADSIGDLLVNAAEKDVVQALRVVGYLAVQQDNSREFGIRCLRRAALRGDVVSWFNLAATLLELPGDDTKTEAAFWLQQAANQDYPLASSLLAEDSSLKPDRGFKPVDATIGPLESLVLFPNSNDERGESFCDDPPIMLYPEVLGVMDRAYLMFMARPSLVRANVINPSSETAGLVSDVRTSTSTYLPFVMVDIIGRYIEQKIALRTGEDLQYSEPMSILRYEPGQYYRPHVDYFNPRLQVSDELLKDGGQRTASAVTYLTTPTRGGSTSFPKLDLTLPAIAGSTLWFRNCDGEGQTTDRSLHAGEPVEAGEKWVVTKWFRQNPTRYFEI